MEILENYIKGEDIYTTAKRIVDTLWTWESFVSLMSYNEDPWRAYSRQILYVEEIIAMCGDAVEQGLGYNDLTACVLDALSNTDP